jgi:hypothetical protein
MTEKKQTKIQLILGSLDEKGKRLFLNEFKKNIRDETEKCEIQLNDNLKKGVLDHSGGDDCRRQQIHIEQISLNDEDSE